MGKGVTSCALAALLNVVHTLMNLCQVDLGDVVAMVTKGEAAPDLAWLSSCLQDRDVAVSISLQPLHSSGRYGALTQTSLFSLPTSEHRYPPVGTPSSPASAAVRLELPLSLAASPESPLACGGSAWRQLWQPTAANLSGSRYRRLNCCAVSLVVQCSLGSSLQAACVLFNLSTLCTREGKWDQLLAVQGQEVGQEQGTLASPHATDVLCVVCTHLPLQGDVLRGAAVLELMLAQYQVVASVVSSSVVPNELWAQLRAVVKEGQSLDSPCKANSSRFCLFLRHDSSTEGRVQRGKGRGESQSVAVQESRAVLMAEVRTHTAQPYLRSVSYCSCLPAVPADLLAFHIAQYILRWLLM